MYSFERRSRVNPETPREAIALWFSFIVSVAVLDHLSDGGLNSQFAITVSSSERIPSPCRLDPKIHGALAYDNWSVPTLAGLFCPELKHPTKNRAGLRF